MISIVFAIKVSGIGVIPILLVVLIALFLWGSVVYNSLKARKNTMDAQLQLVGKLAFQRVQLLTAVGNLLKTDFLTDANGYDEAKLQSETQLIEETVSNLSLQNDLEVTQLQTNLTQNAAQLMQSQRKFRAARKSYNELCQQNPYRLIASLFAFKPLAT